MAVFRAPTKKVSYCYTVEEGVRDGKHETVLGTTTKGKRERRNTLMLPTTVALLGRAQAQQAVYGAAWHAGLFVFGDGETFLHPSTAYGRLKTACKRQGVPVLGPHAIRHTTTTHAVEGGVSLKLIADRLGHRGIDLVVELYGHATEAGDRQVRDALARMLEG